MDYIHFGIFYKKKVAPVLTNSRACSHQIQKGNSGKTPFTLLWLHIATLSIARYGEIIRDACVNVRIIG